VSQHPLFFVGFMSVRFLVQQLHSSAVPEFRWRFSWFFLTCFGPGHCYYEVRRSALCMFFGRTQPLKIYVRLIVCIILQSMSKYLAGGAKKSCGRFMLCSVVSKWVQRTLMITG